jgi:hypothetical protein
VKIPILQAILGEDPIKVGVETKHKKTAEYKFTYPGDVIINTYELFYHNPIMTDLGDEVFGYSQTVGPTRGFDRFGNPIDLSVITDDTDACSALD